MPNRYLSGTFENELAAVASDGSSQRWPLSSTGSQLVFVEPVP